MVPSVASHSSLEFKALIRSQECMVEGWGFGVETLIGSLCSPLVDDWVTLQATHHTCSSSVSGLSPGMLDTSQVAKEPIVQGAQTEQFQQPSQFWGLKFRNKDGFY